MNEPTDQDYRSLAEFRYRIRKFLRTSEELARAAGIEPQQHQLLLSIKGQGGFARVADLAEALQIRHNSTVELIDRAEAGGFVRRERGEGDRREVNVTLTASGEAILRELSRHHLAELSITGPALISALDGLVGARAKAER